MRSESTTMMLEVATLSANLRIQDRLGLRPSYEGDAWRERTDPFIRLNDAILKGMEALGRFCRDNGIDARQSVFWPLLEHQSRYVEKYEFRRKVTVNEITPAVIFNGLSLENKILYNGWSIYLGSARETTDDFGQPTWESRVWVSSPSEEVEMFSGISKNTARLIYRHITGIDFVGNDGLGDDPLHPAERCGYYDYE